VRARDRRERGGDARLRPARATRRAGGAKSGSAAIFLEEAVLLRERRYETPSSLADAVLASAGSTRSFEPELGRDRAAVSRARSSGLE